MNFSVSLCRFRVNIELFQALDDLSCVVLDIGSFYSIVNQLLAS